MYIYPVSRLPFSPFSRLGKAHGHVSTRSEQRVYAAYPAIRASILTSGTRTPRLTDTWSTICRPLERSCSSMPWNGSWLSNALKHLRRDDRLSAECAPRPRAAHLHSRSPSHSSGTPGPSLRRGVYTNPRTPSIRSGPLIFKTSRVTQPDIPRGGISSSRAATFFPLLPRVGSGSRLGLTVSLMLSADPGSIGDSSRSGLSVVVC